MDIILAKRLNIALLADDIDIKADPLIEWITWQYRQGSKKEPAISQEKAIKLCEILGIDLAVHVERIEGFEIDKKYLIKK